MLVSFLSILFLLLLQWNHHREAAIPRSFQQMNAFRSLVLAFSPILNRLWYSVFLCAFQLRALANERTNHITSAVVIPRPFGRSGYSLSSPRYSCFRGRRFITVTTEAALNKFKKIRMFRSWIKGFFLGGGVALWCCLCFRHMNWCAWGTAARRSCTHRWLC